MKKLALIFALITLPITTLLAQEDAGLVKVKNSETQMPRVNTSTGKLHMLWYRQGWFIDGNAGVRFLGKTSDAADMKIGPDRKSTRLNSSHVRISYAVFCLKKKNTHYLTSHSFYFSLYGHHRHLHSFPTRRSSDLLLKLRIQKLKCPVSTPPLESYTCFGTDKDGLLTEMPVFVF